eukprot:m.385046 g.385046  ORF g.385046 m.385046 type:complete len:418 (+) comp16737_c2_seq7:3335-4588(+)
MKSSSRRWTLWIMRSAARSSSNRKRDDTSTLGTPSTPGAVSSGSLRSKFFANVLSSYHPSLSSLSGSGLGAGILAESTGNSPTVGIRRGFSWVPFSDSCARISLPAPVGGPDVASRTACEGVHWPRSFFFWSFPISFFHGFDLNVDHWTMSGGKSKQPDYNSVALSIQEDIDSLRPCQYFCEDSGHQLSDADAFSIQLAARDIRKARGEHVAGFKIGCTSNAIQSQFGLQEAVRGYIWAEERHPSGTTISTGRFRNLAIEGEIAVYIEEAVGPVEEWVVLWAPVIELHHFKFDRLPPSSAELISRNAIHGGTVEVGPGSRARGKLSNIDIDETLTITITGETTSVYQTTLRELPGGPAGTVSWLAAQGQFQDTHDEQLLRSPNTIILTSSPAGLYPVKAGDTVTVSWGSMQVITNVE